MGLCRRAPARARFKFQEGWGPPRRSPRFPFHADRRPHCPRRPRCLHVPLPLPTGHTSATQRLSANGPLWSSEGPRRQYTAVQYPLRACSVASLNLRVDSPPTSRWCADGADDADGKETDLGGRRRGGDSDRSVFGILRTQSGLRSSPHPETVEPGPLEALMRPIGVEGWECERAQ